MTTDFVRVDSVSIEKTVKKTINPRINTLEKLSHETPPVRLKRKFGIVDLWKIRKAKRYFSIYGSR